MENNEQSIQDVPAEAPSAPVESSPESVSTESATPDSSQKEVPFHEHPRFKELINQRNEFSQRLQEYEKRFQELNTRFDQNKPKETPPEAKMLERLKSIDPEFGSMQEQIIGKLAKLEQLEQWKAQQEAQQRNTNVNSQLEKLHSEHKVSNEIKEMYEARLKVIAQSDPNLTLSDLPRIYKQVHEGFSKYMESIKRDTLSSYTQGKTKDASIPAPSKGSAPKSAKPKFEYSKDPYEARSQIVKNALKSLKES